MMFRLNKTLDYFMFTFGLLVMFYLLCSERKCCRHWKVVSILYLELWVHSSLSSKGQKVLKMKLYVHQSTIYFLLLIFFLRWHKLPSLYLNKSRNTIIWIVFEMTFQRDHFTLRLCGLDFEMLCTICLSFCVSVCMFRHHIDRRLPILTK